jgi:hypothetical protein
MTHEPVDFFRFARTPAFSLCVALLSLLPAFRLRADQVEMQNGERYVGKVLSLNADTLVIQSEGLGALRLPRSKVAAVSFGPNAASSLAQPALQTNSQPHGGSGAPISAAPGLSSLPQGAGSMTNLIQQVQAQFLSDASPEAKDKFNELVGGLLSGKLTVNDIRAQAQSAADQIRAAKRELGDEAGNAMDGYLAILDQFLKQTAPSPTSSTNVSSPSPQVR